MNEIAARESETYEHIRNTILTARSRVYTAVNFEMLVAYLEIGKEIVTAQQGNERAEYDAGLVKYLSEKLTAEFGKGFDENNLRRMRQFYLSFQIRGTLCHELSWSHYRLLMKVDNDTARQFYLEECAKFNWSVRQLGRQINSFFYECLGRPKEDELEADTTKFLKSGEIRGC